MKESFKTIVNTEHHDENYWTMNVVHVRFAQCKLYNGSRIALAFAKKNEQGLFLSLLLSNTTDGW